MILNSFKALALNYYFLEFVYITIFSLKILYQKDFMIVLSWHFLLLVSFFNLFNFLSLCLKKRSATHCKSWLLIFKFTAINNEIQDF
ncbi:hypothetical protein FIM48_00030 [Helicobacter pylori]|nr:hypothetical protein FIM48_00030 [Helicobacter pylori]